jgi:hypothetical protein
MTKRILLTIDDDLYNILQTIKGFGDKDAEKANKIIVAYLSEHGYLSQQQKKE